MVFHDIFAKDINRKIEGVIYADDTKDEELLNELKEYVITDEVKGHLQAFLDEYNGNSFNGSWISGFFGSGKSHLLKMLALVLENRTICGESSAQIFIDKCSDEPLLSGALKKATALPSKSILFNIDRRADSSGVKEHEDLVLPIFLKVFNEVCGYCPDRPAIADFERHLDEDGQLDTFKTAFEAQTGHPWQGFGWTRWQRFEKQIDAAYQQATGTNATGVLKTHTNGYACSVDDFARMVKAYIKRQAPGFKLNFFVDEVGQFVANNVKLMLNLQSVAEALNSECRRQSWLIVTSQSDVDVVTGEMDRSGGDTFSRIMDRFQVKMPLSSVNAGEVIQLRLLAKKPESVPALAEVYAAESANMKTMYDFVDGSKKYKFFEGERNFVDVYPLVPYQFFLFREAMLHLSRHDAFTSRFQSVGERSTLNVCQRVLQRLEREGAPVGTMAPFDYWYDGIAESIKPEVRGQIEVAEKNLDLPGNLKPLAVHILKALLLVKYLTADFKPTVRNICSLLITDLKVDFSQHLADVGNALGHLVDQSYVQCVAECYEYLTDSEKDLDKDIKATLWSDSDITELMKKVLFGSILRGARKINWKEQPYAFTQMMDGSVVSRADGDLSVNFVTPGNPEGGDLLALKAKTLGKDELTLVMGNDPQLIRDVVAYIQTDNFLRVNPPIAQSDLSRKRLLQSRQDGQASAMSNIEARIRELVGTATVLVRGTEVPVGSSNAADRVIEGFGMLATQVYSSLPIIAGYMSYSDADIPRFLHREATLPGMEKETEGMKEIQSHLRLNQTSGTRTTLRTLVAHFTAKPYGWPQGVIQCLVAELLASGKVEMSTGGAVVATGDYRAVLTNTRNFDLVILEPQTDVTMAQIAKLRTFAGDFFDEPVAATDAKAVAAEVMARFKDRLADWEALIAQRGQFPFLSVLEPIVAQTRKLVQQKDMSLYNKDFAAAEEAWLDLRDDPVEPVTNLMAGEQKKIYERARDFVQANRPNVTHLLANGENGELKSHWDLLAEKLNSPTIYKAGGITQTKALHDALKIELETALARARTSAKSVIEDAVDKVKTMTEYAAAKEGTKNRVAAERDAALARVDGEKLIASIRDIATTFKDHTYIELVKSVLADVTPPTPLPPTPGNEGNPPPPPPSPATGVVEFKRVASKYDKSVLATTSELDAYLAFLKESLTHEITAGRKVIL